MSANTPTGRLDMADAATLDALLAADTTDLAALAAKKTELLALAEKSEELLALAYDRTLTNTGSLKWSYMNGILKSWHEKGLHTEAEVRDRDTRKAKGRAGKPEATRNMDKLLAALEKI